MKNVLQRLARWTLRVCATLLIGCAVLVALGRVLVPGVASYRDEVEDKASAALGLPVTVASLDGQWSGLAPELFAHDVVVGSGSDQLRLEQVRIVPDLWRSLLTRSLRIEHVQLSGLQLAVKQDEAGQWALAGLPHQTNKPVDPQQILEQLQAVAEISLFDSQVTVQPWQQAPSALTYVQMTLHTGASRQRLDLNFSLPDGQPVAVNIDSQARADDWQNARADIYASLPLSDWAHWLPASLSARWNITALKAGGEVWATWAAGNIVSATARVQVPQLEGGYVGNKPVRVGNLTGGVYFRRTEQGADLLLDSLALNVLRKRSGDMHWGDAHILLQQRRATEQEPETWHVQADRIDLTPLTPLAQAFAPLPEKLAAALTALKVKGALRNVLLDYRPQVEGDQRLSFAANVDQIGFDAYKGAPATENVSGSVSGNLGQGELRLASDGFMLYLAPIYDKPWHYQKANATLQWKIDKDAVTLISPYLKVLGDEGKIAGDFLIKLFFDRSLESYMDLRIGLVDGDARFTEKYLPSIGLSPALSDWLKTSIKSGAIDEGIFQYSGSLMHDAEPGSRTIDLFFKVHNTELAFQPGWPSLTGIRGDVFVENNGVRIRADQGQMLNTQVSNVAVDVPHASSGQTTHLNILGDFKGSLGDGLKILQEAPIGTADIFAGWEGDGPLNGNLQLDIPLAKGEQPQIVVGFNTDGARLQLSNPALNLEKLKGAFQFNLAKGLSGKNIQAQVLDKPITADIYAEGKPGQNRTRIDAKGSVTLDKLKSWAGISQPLPASGEIPYRLQITLDGINSQLQVDSSLRGVALDLPAPFGKAADEERGSQVRLTLQGPQRQYWVNYGTLANLAYVAPNGQLTDGRGELFLGNGGAVIPAAKGLRVEGEISEFDLTPWQALLQRYSTGAASNPGDGAKQFIRSVNVKIGKLLALGGTAQNVSLQLERDDSAWSATFASDIATGKVSLPDSKATPITIDLQHLRFPAAEPVTAQSDDVEKPDPLANVTPNQIPPVNLHIAQVLQGDQLLGEWSGKARPTATGLVFSDLNMGLKGLQLSGAGAWDGDAGSTRSWFKGRMEGKNVAEVLKAWGFAPTATSSDFHLDADGRWPGSPAWVAVKHYSGSLNAVLNKGQLTEADGGAQALRVFGLLNFNSIGRRLRLDFSDILGKGLSYDRVKGLLVADQGVYVTREPITLSGPSSNLELNGTLDMVNDQVNAELMVTLPLSNNLPIAALIVGAPAIGGALFIADKLFGDKVARFASVRYSIVGPWKDPKISFDKPLGKLFDKNQPGKTPESAQPPQPN